MLVIFLFFGSLFGSCAYALELETDAPATTDYPGDPPFVTAADILPEGEFTVSPSFLDYNTYVETGTFFAPVIVEWNEDGETTGDIHIDTQFFTTELETYGYRLITRNVALPENETALREAISLVNWWCDPSAQYAEDVAPAFEYVGVKLINNELECFHFSTGYFEEGEFVWCGAFAVDFNATQIYELNNQTMEYKLIYQEK